MWSDVLLLKVDESYVCFNRFYPNQQLMHSHQKEWANDTENVGEDFGRPPLSLGVCQTDILLLHSSCTLKVLIYVECIWNEVLNYTSLMEESKLQRKEKHIY